MAYNRYRVDNFFVTTISADQTLTHWVDGVLNLVNVPNIEDGKLFFVVARVNDPSYRVVIPVYMDWGLVKYKGYNIDWVIDLYKYDEVALNDLAELFNTILELTDDVGKVVKKWGLDILVYGWEIVKSNQQISVPDTDLVLTDNAINYIIFDYSDDSLKSVTTLSWAYYLFATINCSGGEINSINRKRALNVNDFYSALFFEKDNNGELIIKDWAIKQLQIDFTSFDADHIFNWQTHLFLSPQERQDIATNKAERHTHPNKTLLDSYTQSEANLSDAVQKKHNHTNKTVLDLIPDTAWVPDNYVMKKVGATIIRWPGWGGGWGGWSTVAYTDIFVGDWVSDVFNLSHSPLSDNVVFMTNDSGQSYYNGIDYVRVWQTVTFDSVPELGRHIYVRYFENVDTTQIGETNTMINLPWQWIGVYKQKTWVQFQMRRVRWDGGITVYQDWDELVVDWHVSVWPGWETNTASNVGPWIWLYKQKVGVDLQFKTLADSDTVTLVENNDGISFVVNQQNLNPCFYRHFMF